MSWHKKPWWKTRPYFGIDTESFYKSVYIGWVLIVWCWEDWRITYLDIDFDSD